MQFACMRVQKFYDISLILNSRNNFNLTNLYLFSLCYQTLSIKSKFYTEVSQLFTTILQGVINVIKGIPGYSSVFGPRHGI